MINTTYNYIKKLSSFLLFSTAFATDKIPDQPITISGGNLKENLITAPNKIKEDTLPTDREERDALLVNFHNKVIPLLLSWQVAHNQPLDFFKVNNQYELLERLFTPFPYNPYREPGMDRLFPFPGNGDQWDAAISRFRQRQLIHGKIIQICQAMIEENKKQSIIHLVDESLIIQNTILPVLRDPPLNLLPQEISKVSQKPLWLSLLQRPEAYTVKDFHIHKLFQDTAAKVLDEKNFSIKAHPLTDEEKNEIMSFQAYHEDQLKKLTYFLDLFDPIRIGTKPDLSIMAPETFFEMLPGVRQAIKEKKPLSPDRQEVAALYTKMKPFFLGSRKKPSELINLGFLEGKLGNKEAEVIVYDLEPGYSGHLNYSRLAPQSYLSVPEKKAHFQADFQAGLKEPSHSTGVSGIIGGKPKLEHLQGIVPGIQILPIEQLTPGTLELMKNSKARVVNISRNLDLSKACQQYLTLASLPSGLKDEKCKNLREFIRLIIKKDMIVVSAAGNEGLQLEEIDWTTGKMDNLTNSARGFQHEKNIGKNKYDGDQIDLCHILNQIPGLKGRVIFVGNLYADGVTVARSSSLPGAFSDNFIFAPSGDIPTLYPSVMRTENDKMLYGELGSFGGTSGAAPRVAAVIALLAQLFPDLPMTDIVDCVLKTGDPFWLSPNNKLEELAKICGTTSEKCSSSYGKRIVGRGRINVEKAYDLCSQKNEERRKSVSSPGILWQKEPYANLPQQDAENPIYRIMHSPDVSPTILDDVGSYYTKNPQTKVIDKDLGLVPPLQLAIGWEEKLPGIITVLLDNNPQLSKQEATRILKDIMIWKKNTPLRLFEFLLIKNKADPNVMNSNGDTLLRQAIASEEFDLAKLLLNQGADPNLGKGDSPLISVFFTDPINIDLVNLLLEKGADPTVQVNGLTPLMVAEMKKRDDIVKLLQKYIKGV